MRYFICDGSDCVFFRFCRGPWPPCVRACVCVCYYTLYHCSIPFASVRRYSAAANAAAADAVVLTFSILAVFAFVSGPSSSRRMHTHTAHKNKYTHTHIDTHLAAAVVNLFVRSLGCVRHIYITPFRVRSVIEPQIVANILIKPPHCSRMANAAAI